MLIHSLKKNREFRFIYNRGKSLANKNLVVFISQNPLGINRLGISVSKKVGNSVVRNRAKRLIREGYRLFENDLKNGYDIVAVARQSIPKSNFLEIQKGFFMLLKKHGVVK